jgi:hypothetical protein
MASLLLFRTTYGRYKLRALTETVMSEKGWKAVRSELLRILV